MNRLILRIYNAMTFMVLLFAYKDSHGDYELLNLINSSDHIALVTILGSATVHEVIGRNGEAVNKLNTRCHYIYNGNPIEIYKGKFPSEFSFTSKSGLITGRDYFLFLTNTGQPGQNIYMPIEKVQIGLEIPKLGLKFTGTCKDLMAPVALFALESTNKTYWGLPLGRLNNTNDGQTNGIPNHGVKYDPLDLTLPDVLVATVMRHSIQDGIDSESELYKAETFINKDKLIKFIKDTVQNEALLK